MTMIVSATPIQSPVTLTIIALATIHPMNDPAETRLASASDTIEPANTIAGINHRRIMNGNSKSESLTTRISKGIPTNPMNKDIFSTDSKFSQSPIVSVLWSYYRHLWIIDRQ